MEARRYAVALARADERRRAAAGAVERALAVPVDREKIAGVLALADVPGDERARLLGRTGP